MINTTDKTPREIAEEILRIQNEIHRSIQNGRDLKEVENELGITFIKPFTISQEKDDQN